MSQVSNELRIADYSDWRVLCALVPILLVTIGVTIASFWLNEVLAFLLVWLVAPLALFVVVAVAWGLRKRAFSVQFGDQVVVETLRGSVTYPRVDAWGWSNHDALTTNGDLWLYFDDGEKREAWRIPTIWQEVEQANQWLRPDLYGNEEAEDLGEEDVPMSKAELLSLRMESYKHIQQEAKRRWSSSWI